MITKVYYNTMFGSHLSYAFVVGLIFISTGVAADGDTATDVPPPPGYNDLENRRANIGFRTRAGIFGYWGRD